MVLNGTRNSELFNTLSRMGLTSTEECRIRKYREADDSLYEDLDLSNDDIERVGYLYPHVNLKPAYKDHTELWFGDIYLNPKSMTWIETVNTLYGILDQKYDETVPVKCFYNPAIIYRYNNVAEEGDDTQRTHVVTIKVDDVMYASIPNIEHAAYYITQSKVCVPESSWLDEKTLVFRAPYVHDVDFFICGNVVNAVQVTAGSTVLLDNSYSNRCYHRILVDHDASYPIDARFYPAVTVDKDCVLRVFSDSYHLIQFPAVSRLINYPEYLEITDYYNSEDEYLKNLQPVDEIILADDTDEEIHQKFEKIAAYCYRLWENFPVDLTEQSDFLICDNESFSNPTFVPRAIYLYDEVITKICSTVPYDPDRDLLVYNGLIFSDYTIKTLAVTSDGKWVESDRGQPRYLIDISYDVNKFTLIKFNTAQDTNFINIGDYVDEENLAQLHHKINRFYRNLMIVRQKFLDPPTDEYVRLANVTPTTMDDYLWFDLLVNAVPEMFETRAIDQISLYGLDAENIPEVIQNGAYMLEMDPKDGPVSYTDLMMTYFKLDKNRQRYLVLQYGEGIDDTRVNVFHDLKIGKPENNEDELNTMLIEDMTKDITTTVTKYDAGYPDTPGTTGYSEDDIYVQNDTTLPPEPGAENIDIDQISYGGNEPVQDEHTLWVDTGTTGGGVAKDSLDATATAFTAVNDVSEIENPVVSMYALDSNDDTFTEEGELTIDDLFGGETEMEELSESEMSLMDGLAAVVAKNITIDDIENPEVGQIALDNISYMDDDGTAITMDEIAEMTTETKLGIVNKYITDDDEPENANIGDMWIEYMSTMDPEVLNTVVYKILLTAYVYDLHAVTGDLALEGDGLPETAESIAYGEHMESIKPNQMLLQPSTLDEDGNVVPDYEAIRHHNVRYIMSINEPDDVYKDDLWINMPAITLQIIIKDVISQTLAEIGIGMPKGFFYDDGNTQYATMGLDYVAHDLGTAGLGDVFQVRKDDTLHPIHYGYEGEVDPESMENDDIWYEFLDTVDGKVVYSDTTSMVIRIDERLVMVNFRDEYIQAFAFDDILLNFRGRSGMRYLSVVADLVNSGEISLDDLNIFYKRMITFGDEFDPRLKRLYTGTSHVVSTIKIDNTDYEILYSSNIGRFRMDYSAEETTNKEREAAYRMCIDYRKRDFAFLNGRMLLFVNGKYIPRNQYDENTKGMIHLHDFKEIIATVDILYSKKDQMFMDIKRYALKYYPETEVPEMIERPSQYGVMEPIKVYDYTKRGYYDVLLEEYLFNGKLLRILQYLEEHPEESEEYKRDLVRKFHAISDVDLIGDSDKTARIVIAGNSNTSDVYQIGE